MKSLLSDKYYVTLFGIMECNFYILIKIILKIKDLKEFHTENFYKMN